MSKNYFPGKTVLITGASSGIGKALALALAASNVQLILTARRIDELEALSKSCTEKGSSCFYFYLDVSISKSIDDFCYTIKKDFSCIDILINNAGISQRSLAEETELKVDRMLMEVNFFGTVHLTKSLFPLVLKSENGQVVLMSSLTGTFGFPQRSAYAASKHAIEGFFQSWVLENQHHNISFTVIAPGRIRTNISYSALKKDGTAHALLDKGQEKGIPAEVCAAKIINAIKKQKRKVYIIANERPLIFLYKYFPAIFEWVIKKFKLSLYEFGFRNTASWYWST